jgi:PAS domain S-box-containing protein
MRGEEMTERDTTGIELLLSQPEIVAWLEQGHSTVDLDAPTFADTGKPLIAVAVGTGSGPAVAARRSEATRLAALIDNMPAHVYARDLEGRFILANRQYHEFWGVPREAIRGKTLAETDRLSEVDLAPSVNARIDRVVLATRRPRRREARVMRRGKEHVLSDVRFPVLDGAGDVVALAGIDIDITTQKQTEAELAERLQRVEEAIEETAAQSRFLASVSYELRTPLSEIIDSVRSVSRNAQSLPPSQIDDLGKILVSAEHLLSRVEELSQPSQLALPSS